MAAGLLPAGVALLFVPLLVIRVGTGGRLGSDPTDVSHHQVAGLATSSKCKAPSW